MVPNGHNETRCLLLNLTINFACNNVLTLVAMLVTILFQVIDVQVLNFKPCDSPIQYLTIYKYINKIHSKIGS